MRALLRNPLTRRYGFSLLRRWNLIATLGIYFSLLATINFLSLLYVFRLGGVSSLGVPLIAETALPWIAGLAVLILWAMASNAPSAVLTNQYATGARMFFDLLPLSGKRKAWGLLIGANLLYYPLAILTLFIGTQYALIAGVKLASVLTLLFLVIGLGAFLNTMSLLASTSASARMAQMKTSKGKSANVSPGVAMILVASLVGLPAMLAVASSFENADAAAEYAVPFFAWNVPLLLLLAVIAFVLACWCFAGAARQLGPLPVPLFSRFGAVWFLVLSEFVALGFFWKGMVEQRHPEQYAAMPFLLSIAAAFLVGVGGSRRSRDIYEAIHAGAASGKTPVRRVMDIVLESNSALFACLIAVWLAFNALVFICIGAPPLKSFALFASTLLFMAWSALAWELFNLFKVEYSHKHYVVGFGIALYVLGPFLAGMLSRDAFLLSLNPVGYVIVAFSGSTVFRDAVYAPPQVIAVHIFSLAVMGWLVYWKYASAWRSATAAVRGPAENAENAEGAAKQ